jgi:hypothetical protein
MSIILQVRTYNGKLSRHANLREDYIKRFTRLAEKYERLDKEREVRYGLGIWG